MIKLTELNEDTQDGVETSFYLPAVAPSSNLEKWGNVIDKLFEFHGVVLIPDTYNE